MSPCKSPPLPKRQILIDICDHVMKLDRSKKRDKSLERKWLTQVIDRKGLYIDKNLIFPIYSSSFLAKEGVDYMPIIHSCVCHNDADLLKMAISAKLSLNELYDDMTPMQYALSIGQIELAKLVERYGGV